MLQRINVFKISQTYHLGCQLLWAYPVSKDVKNAYRSIMNICSIWKITSNASQMTCKNSTCCEYYDVHWFFSTLLFMTNFACMTCVCVNHFIGNKISEIVKIVYYFLLRSLEFQEYMLLEYWTIKTRFEFHSI